MKFFTLLNCKIFIKIVQKTDFLNILTEYFFSAFGAATFSLGSVLVWAIIRSVIPQNVVLCTTIGIGSGLALLKIASNYVDHIDSLTEKK